MQQEQDVKYEGCRSASTPPQQEEGWPRHQEEAAKPPLMERTGWCGQEILTTPPRLRELMWLRGFLLIAHPPLLLLRRGAEICNFQSVPRLDSSTWQLRTLVQPNHPGSGTFFRDLQEPPDVFIACYVGIRTAGRALCQERQVDLGTVPVGVV